MDGIFNKIAGPLYKRLSNPIIYGFLISWCIYNFQDLSYLIFDESDINSRTSVFLSSFTWWKRLFLPFVSSLGLYIVLNLFTIAFAYVSYVKLKWSLWAIRKESITEATLLDQINKNKTYDALIIENKRLKSDNNELLEIKNNLENYLLESSELFDQAFVDFENKKGSSLSTSIMNSENIKKINDQTRKLITETLKSLKEDLHSRNKTRLTDIVENNPIFSKPVKAPNFTQSKP